MIIEMSNSEFNKIGKEFIELCKNKKITCNFLVEEKNEYLKQMQEAQKNFMTDDSIIQEVKIHYD